jgi:hypothetical protein
VDSVLLDLPLAQLYLELYLCLLEHPELLHTLEMDNLASTNGPVSDPLPLSGTDLHLGLVKELLATHRKLVTTGWPTHL